MKTWISGLMFCAVLAVCAAEMKMPVLHFNPPPREIVMSKNVVSLIANGKCNVEIVSPVEAGEVAKYAGEEIQKFVQQATGVKIPLVTARGKAEYAVILGNNALFKKAFPDRDVEKLHRDGFYMLTKGKEIYIAGKDDSTKKIRKFLKTRSGEWWNDNVFHRATLFGAYDFLERFAGIRFYFDGEIGTVIPQRKSLNVPAEIRIMDRPDFTDRRVTWLVLKQDEWYDDRDPVEASNRNLLRWRLGTYRIPCCHGLNALNFEDRYAKTKPELFALWKDGKRYIKDMPYAPQLCMSNKELPDLVAADAIAYLKGESAKSRGIKGPGGGYYWQSCCFQPGFVDIMPNDGFKFCLCKECQKYYANMEKDPKKASNLIWQVTADVANKVKAAKVPGYLTQMAYHFYKVVPDVEIPDNVLLVYASAGPWQDKTPVQKKVDAEISAWNKKLKNKIGFWNYCINQKKWGENYSVDIPHTTPLAVGNYYKRNKDRYYGGFLECESHHFIWGAMNIYVATKMFWNADQSVEKIMDEFYELLFTKAAPEMKEFFETVEKNWIASKEFVDTPEGPKSVPPTQFNIWTKLYTPASVKHLTALFDKAEKKCADDAMTLKRIKFFRKNYLDIILKNAAEYHQQQNDVRDALLPVTERKGVPALDKLQFPRGKTAWLRRLGGKPTEVPLRAMLQKDNDNLYIIAQFDEPEMARLKYSKKENAPKFLWEDATFEIFLNPSGDYRNYYQIAVHPSGYYQPRIYPLAKEKKDTGIKVRTYIGKEFWSAEVTIPLKDLPGRLEKFPANLSYNRQLKDEKPYERTFSWSPFLTDNFHAIDKFGLIDLSGEKDPNLVKDWNFDAEFNGDKLGEWFIPFPSDSNFEGAIEPDGSTFISGGQSVYMRMDKGRHLAATQLVKLEPGKTYTFSYWIKYNIKGGGNAIIHLGGCGKNLFLPALQFRGKTDWHNRSYTFTTPKNVKGLSTIRFCLASGEMWIDNIRITEVKK